ncbi:uncharacterized protein G2W53_004895 [Senna tora]|uniref:Uncharacterized protein n=1 Tax=Senna tora TaxID=362788 RepID=A0A835CKP7_9FABA|nr:uncharacterized protein G2W53_004895 [Senna tora]
MALQGLSWASILDPPKRITQALPNPSNIKPTRAVPRPYGSTPF